MLLPLLLFLLSNINALKIFESENTLEYKTFYHRTASFGPRGFNISSPLKLFHPTSACISLNDSTHGQPYSNKIVLILRGNCTFIEKVFNAQILGAVGVIVGDNNNKSDDHQWIIMSQEDSEDSKQIEIPSVFVQHNTYQWIELLLMNERNVEIFAMMDSDGEYTQPSHALWLASFGIIMIVIPAIWCLLIVITFVRSRLSGWRERRRRNLVFNSIPVISFNGISSTPISRIDDDGQLLSNVSSFLPTFMVKCNDKPLNEICCICLDEFVVDDELKLLGCLHAFHPKCIAPVQCFLGCISIFNQFSFIFICIFFGQWLREQSDMCPMCKQSIFGKTDGSDRSETVEEVNAVNRLWAISREFLNRTNIGIEREVDIDNDDDGVVDEVLDGTIAENRNNYSRVATDSASG